MSQGAKPEGQSKANRKPGRPKKSDSPLVPWKEVDELLVMGDEVVTENGDKVVHYPTYRELADKYGVAASLIASYSRRHACLHRRNDAEARVRAFAESQIMERRAAELAVSNEDALKIIDMGILEFGKALEEGRARVDTVADLNTLLRLKQLLLGAADSRQEVMHGLSLEDLQKKHNQMLRVIAETSATDRKEGSRLLLGAEVSSKKSDIDTRSAEDDDQPPAPFIEAESQKMNVQLNHTGGPADSEDTRDVDELEDTIGDTATDTCELKPGETGPVEGDVAAPDGQEDVSV
ncbi:MAG: hypothetical protein GY854_03320 [Deltaproteobacteria bacterium]|nr:hypothetical protein [Deltaproteobacteria bacterium]